jgi:hypothetical protein
VWSSPWSPSLHQGVGSSLAELSYRFAVLSHLPPVQLALALVQFAGEDGGVDRIEPEPAADRPARQAAPPQLPSFDHLLTGEIFTARIRVLPPVLDGACRGGETLRHARFDEGLLRVGELVGEVTGVRPTQHLHVVDGQVAASKRLEGVRHRSQLASTAHLDEGRLRRDAEFVAEPDVGTQRAVRLPQLAPIPLRQQSRLGSGEARLRASDGDHDVVQGIIIDTAQVGVEQRIQHAVQICDGVVAAVAHRATPDCSLSSATSVARPPSRSRSSVRVDLRVEEGCITRSRRPAAPSRGDHAHGRGRHRTKAFGSAVQRSG